MLVPLPSRQAADDDDIPDNKPDGESGWPPNRVWPRSIRRIGQAASFRFLASLRESILQYGQSVVMLIRRR